MVASIDPSTVKVYTVNGAATGSSSSLPDWLTRRRAPTVKGKGKRAAREYIEGTIELIQGFDFPEASNRIKTTRDGHHAIATGTYKPQMKVWDLDQLSLKFERHSDAENVDFIILSDDWTKTLHLQNDRTIELHTQGGFHYRTRIPRFGRALAYHFPSCDAFFSASGNEIFRLNLDQGLFLTPLALDTSVQGVNTIDINSAHQLLAFGIDGAPEVHFVDPRSRAGVGVLHLPVSRLLGPNADPSAVSVTALASRTDGLSYAVGTSTGHTLLYDIRAARPYGMKDQGYSLPINNVVWIEGGGRMAGDGMVLSADKKVVKIWEKESPSSNFTSITPASDINHIHHVPHSGLLLAAHEGIQMSTFYIPQLGPAPRWAGFLENITEEMEDTAVRSVYEDYKFVERNELRTLGLDRLVGTPALKPYMHGYFVKLALYDAARVIANPFAYAEHREKLIQQKLDKLAEGRIRSRKDAPGVKVNQKLAEKIIRDQEKERNRLERRKARSEGEDGGEKMNVDGEAEEDEVVEADKMDAGKASLLTDPRFAKLFEDPAFAVDEESREFALMNPSAAAQKQSMRRARGKTAVEEEEEESDLASSDGLGGSNSEDEEGGGSGSDDSSDAGELNKFDPRARPGQQNARAQEAYARNKERNRIANHGQTNNVNMVPVRVQPGGTSRWKGADTNATFGQRRHSGSAPSKFSRREGRGEKSETEMSWVPSSGGDSGRRNDEIPGGRKGKNKEGRRKGVETFGAGLERGGEEDRAGEESERSGRTTRRKGVRSGSRNVFRKIG